MAAAVSARRPVLVVSAAVREKEVGKTCFIVGALRAQRPCQLSRHFPSKLARFSLLERHPCLVLLRPSSDFLAMLHPSLLVYVTLRGEDAEPHLRASQRGPSEAARCASIGDHKASSLLRLQTSAQGSGRGCPLLRASNEYFLNVRVLRARRAPDCSRPTHHLFASGGGQFSSAWRPQ